MPRVPRRGSLFETLKPPLKRTAIGNPRPLTNKTKRIPVTFSFGGGLGDCERVPAQRGMTQRIAEVAGALRISSYL